MDFFFKYVGSIPTPGQFQTKLWLVQNVDRQPGGPAYQTRLPTTVLTPILLLLIVLVYTFQFLYILLVPLNIKY